MGKKTLTTFQKKDDKTIVVNEEHQIDDLVKQKKDLEKRKEDLKEALRVKNAELETLMFETKTEEKEVENELVNINNLIAECEKLNIKQDIIK